MSNDDTATVSSPENFSGRARSAHSTRWPAPTWVPLPSSRTYEGIQSSIVVFATAVRRSFSDFFERRPSRVKSGAGASMSGDATVTTRTCVPTSRGVEHTAVDRQGGDELRIAETRDVVHGQSGLRTEPRRPGLTDLSSLVAEDQQSVAGQEHVPGRRPREGLLPGQLAPHRADQVHATLGDGDDPSAVRLHDVRLVDAGLLDVRLRVLRCACGRLGARRGRVAALVGDGGPRAGPRRWSRPCLRPPGRSGPREPGP